jgi:cytochrome c553
MRLLRTTVLLTTLAASVLAVVRLRLSSRESGADTHAAAAPHAQAGGAGGQRQWFKIAAFLAGLAVGGWLVVASGIMPLKASSGHWPITAWFLHFAMRRSVATHTLGVQAPALDVPRLVLQGAGHYETGCRPCHGSPNLPPPKIVQHMTPHPPSLPPRISTWEPAELFYIVKHGVKFTGMPAWPARQRDDEVWAMVAFLRTLPDLQAEDYQRLVHGEPNTTGDDAPRRGLLEPEHVPRAVTASCGRCHGVDGRGRGAGAFPRLDGQRPTYLYAALQAYARGERQSGIMAPITAGLSLDEMRELALYYGSRQAPPSPPPPMPQASMSAIESGKAIASRGIPRQRVPACIACHGPGATRRNPIYPVLAGQYADYLVLQLELFNKGYRGGSAYAHLMRPVATRLTHEQMRDVALYYASLPAARDPETP